jgi:hypothetical protein
MQSIELPLARRLSEGYIRETRMRGISVRVKNADFALKPLLGENPVLEEGLYDESADEES